MESVVVQRFRQRKILGWVLLFLLCVAPALAHDVEVAGDVAGTWHIEPNHQPKAGETAKVWVALTRRGGEILPLEQANCQLGVYNAPRSQGDEPVSQPTLQPIAIEQYQGIPGADVVFPKTGLYELELGCTPKTAGDFEPFQMTYTLTVATGTSAPQPSASAASPVGSSQPSSQSATAIATSPVQSRPSISPVVGILGMIALVAVLAAAILGIRLQPKKR